MTKGMRRGGGGETTGGEGGLGSHPPSSLTSWGGISRLVVIRGFLSLLVLCAFPCSFSFFSYSFSSSSPNCSCSSRSPPLLSSLPSFLLFHIGLDLCPINALVSSSLLACDGVARGKVMTNNSTIPKLLLF